MLLQIYLKICFTLKKNLIDIASLLQKPIFKVCVSPVLIPNPNFGSKVDLIKKTTDTESQFLRVPCNVCSECLFMRQGALVQRARCMSLDHYIFFCTLTYNKESLPSVTTSTGFSISYADITDLQKMFKRIRHGNLFRSEFKYFFVTERGSERGRPHVHGLIFIPKNCNDDDLIISQLETRIRDVLFHEWKRNYGSDKFPVWKPLFTYRFKFVGGKRISNFDCHYVVPYSTEKGEDDVAFYVTKYVLKSSDKEKRLQQALSLNLVKENEDGTLDFSEYEEIWQLVRSRCLCSKGFGAATDLQKSYVRDCIHRSSRCENGFQFYAKDGSVSPLSRYYRKFISADDAIRSVAARGGPISFDDRPQDLKDSSISSGNRILSEIARRDLSILIYEDED